MLKIKVHGIYIPLSLFIIFILFIPTYVRAMDTMIVEETFTDRSITKYWERVERIRLDNPNIKQEKFIFDNEHKKENIIKEFGNTSQPNSQLFLLHYAEGWDSNIQPTPVLFVHGAGKDGDYAADPVGDGSVEGLMQY